MASYVLLLITSFTIPISHMNVNLNLISAVTLFLSLTRPIDRPIDRPTDPTVIHPA